MYKRQGLLQAVRLYRGPFLPKLSGEYWAASLSTYYHSLYLTSVKDLAALLEENSRFEEMGAVCQKAIQLDALDEELHCCFIKALIGQNKQNLAPVSYTHLDVYKRQGLYEISYITAEDSRCRMA